MDIKIKYLEKTARNSFWKYYIEIWQDGNYIESNLWHHWSGVLEHIKNAVEFFK